MNKLRQAIVLTAVTASSFGAAEALEANEVNAAPAIEQGIYDIPSGCTQYDTGKAVSISSERALVEVGFTGINPDGKISNSKEQGAVLGAQKFMKEIGVLGSSVDICGYAGSTTEKAVEKMLNPSSLAGESQIRQTVSNSGNSKSSTNVSCDSIELTSWVASRIPGSDGDRKLDNGTEARAVQEALKKEGLYVGNADGVVGSRTLGTFALFQQKEFGSVDCLLGSRTFTALDIEKSERKVVQPTSRTNASSDKNIDIDKVIVDKSDNTLKSYDNGVLVDIDRISHGDDRKYTYFINGRKYNGTATTRTGTSRVYRTEGEDYASKTLGGAPGSMGHARFFDGGLAVHVGNTWSPSHGCIRVGKNDMQELVDRGFGHGDTVIVQE